jgi:hypothetical protein
MPSEDAMRKSIDCRKCAGPTELISNRRACGNYPKEPVMNASRILQILVQSAAALALCAMTGSLAWADSLDGKAFVGEAGEKGKLPTRRTDIITFADGRVHSSACDQWGFNKAQYTTRTEGDATVFETET